MPRHRSSKARRLLEVFLLLAGLTGVGVWVWSNVRLTMFQKQANHALERKIANPPSPSPAPAQNQPPVETGDVIGRLQIPRLKLSAVVREGADHDTLDVALGHIPGTSFPGQPGNVGVAGHRDTLFRGLRKIEKDDVIRFETPNGEYSYQVESTGIVKPQDVDVLKAGQHPEMTLVTCYPFYYVGSAPDRFIVKARLMTPPAAPAPATSVASSTPPPSTAPPVAATPPSPKKRVTTPVRTYRAPVTKPAVRRVAFYLNERQTRQLAPGLVLGLSGTDGLRGRANGWIWVAQERHTIWLHNLKVYQPLFFHRRELMLTSVTRNSASGYVLLYP